MSTDSEKTPLRSNTSNIQGVRSCLLILCFFTAFIVSVIGIRWLTSGPYVSLFSEKLSVFESQKDDYNLVFIGSSHYRSAIDPLLFDRLTTEAGYPTRSFNFSLPGIYLPEILYVLGQIRALEPDNLDWVIVEPRRKVYFREWNSGTQRLIYYHDIPATMMALKCIYHMAEPKGGRSTQYWHHLQHYGYRLTNQGLARSLVTDFFTASAPARTREIQQVISRQGYMPRDGHKFPRSRQNIFLNKVQDFRSTFQKSPLEPAIADQLAMLPREIEKMGAWPIFLFPPIMDSPYELVLPDGAPPTDLVRLDDVERYPQLFALENRWDQGHMNTAGAEQATTAAAEAFLRIAQGKGRR